MSRVLVAGAAGFLGSAVVRQLLAAGEEVVALDVFDDDGGGRAHKEARVAALGRPDRLTLVRGDAADGAFLGETLAAHRPASLVNAMRLPRGRGLGPLGEACRQAGLGMIVHLSDAALYGPRGEAELRAREDEPIEPGEEPDLLAKAAEEEALFASGLPFVILRVFHAAGPGDAPSRFPQDALEALLGDEEVVLPDDAPRDLVHAQDVARGVFFALRRRPLGAIVNLGSGQTVAPSEVVSALARRAGRACRLSISGSAARAPRVADVEKAWQTLGFAPHLGLAEIVHDCVWARLHPADALRAVEPVAERPAPPPPEAPAPVSRRDLFGMFRRPFDAAKKRDG